MTVADAALADHAARLAANADQVALCLDFDGTLSPIVPNPEAVPSHKGDAVRKVVAEWAARSLPVAGDDLGDLAAFPAAAPLAAAGSEAPRVAVRSAEAPPALPAQADLVVEGPPGLRELLRRLAS
jgi:trehalose-6-phosphatase